MISLDLMKSSEVRIAGDRSRYQEEIANELHTKKKYLDWSPAFLTSDDFIRSNEIIRTKWPIYAVIGHFVLTI